MKYLICTIALASGISYAQTYDLYTTESNRRAYSQPIGGLNESEREQFAQGRSLFNQMWVVSPSTDTEVDGLGPFYNRLSCAACHPANGRGRAPDNDSDEMRSMLVRLSRPALGEHGSLKPESSYGEQLNEQGIPGIQGEGQAHIHYIETDMPLNDGTVVKLRYPQLQFSQANYGSMQGLLTSARVAPSIVGLGLLDQVPETEILAWSDPYDVNQDGISGRPNFVWDTEQQVSKLGRFGLKANVPSLKQQIAGAFIGDMGITSWLYPQENCPTTIAACASLPNGGTPELSLAQLQAITFFHQSLAVPRPRHGDDPQVQYGKQLFNRLGCASCHRPELHTRADAQPSFLAKQTIAPYTDLLLHDMGEPLSDGRPDFQASGQEWRTPPLWGIGLAETVGEQVNYLHDGRARTLTEAILWHWGEARNSQTAFRQLNPPAREALLAFLSSL